MTRYVVFWKKIKQLIEYILFFLRIVNFDVHSINVYRYIVEFVENINF